MQNAILELLPQGYTANFTYATDIAYNGVISSQTTPWDAISKVLETCEHVAYLNGTVLHVIDVLLGSTTIALPEYKVISAKTDFASEIVSNVTATYTTKAHDPGGISGTPSLKENSLTLTLPTGVTSGVTKNVISDVQATRLVSGKIVYDTTALQVLLQRKADVLLRESITLELHGFINYTVGTKITFNTPYESGYLVLKEKEFNLRSLKTTFTGLGMYANKEY